MAEQTPFPHRFAEMTDAQIKVYLMLLVAGKDPLTTERPIIAQQEWPKDMTKKFTRYPALIMLGTRTQTGINGGTAVWWDFDRCVQELRAHFPYKAQEVDRG